MAFVKTASIVAPTTQGQELKCFALSETRGLLPDGFPTILNGPMAWSGEQFVDKTDYILFLNQGEVTELENALESFNTLCLDGDEATRENFPLPTLANKLEKLRQQLYNGRGFGLVRGLDPKRYSVDDLTVIYLGIQAHVASDLGRQDTKGNMLVHIVADNSSEAMADHHRHSTAAITFHNEENGDVISWLTRNTAAAGGKCIIASAYTVYNVIAATRPDLIRVLAGSDWPFALPNFHCRPIMYYQNGRLITNFGRTALLGSASHPRSADLPKLTKKQVEALDAIESIAKATQLEVTTRAGDMHFINNFAVLHRREGFVNGETTSQRRHLVRMRLRDVELGWTIPEELKGEWNEAFDASATKIWHLEPMPEGFFPLRTQAN